MTARITFLLASLALLVVLIAACSSPTPAAPATVNVVNLQTPVPPTQAPSASMANPASVYCVQQGGKSEIRKDAKGEVGYCVFPDQSECEEWAFQRGECKPGAKITQVQLTKADNGKTIKIAQGVTIEVVLEGNPGSTGYLWGLESGNDVVLKPQGDFKFSSASNMPGAGGKFSFKFTAASVGTATLKFANKQPWNLNDPKAETFTVTIQVTGAQSSAPNP